MATRGIALAILIGVSWLTASASIITVPEGGNVQAALNSAQPGDTVILLGGIQYPANLTLPVKTGAGYVTIQSSRAGELAPNVRVTPAQSSLFAKLVSIVPAEPVIKTVAGSRGYRFIGIEVATQSAAIVVYDLVRFGDGRDTQKTLEAVPRDLVIDRSWIHGWSTQDMQRGISLNCAACTVSNSHISDIHGVGFDTQAIAGWNGPGPISITNNYLEAAGENVMFGGADSAIAELLPADIEIRRNHIFKPLTWKAGDPSYAGKHWTVKNLLELKSAKRVVIDGNVLENNWTDGQAGVAVLFTVRNQDCRAPWSTVQQVTFTNNTVKNSSGGALNLLGKDNEAEPAYGKCPAGTGGSVRGSDITLSNNLFHGIGGTFLLINGFNNFSETRDTHTQNGNLVTFYGETSSGFKRSNNLTVDHEYGIVGDGVGVGRVALDKHAPGWVWQGDVIANPYDKGAYPIGNDYPASLTLPADFRSPIAGKGADIDALLIAQAGTGTMPSPSPTPTITPTPSPSPVATPSPTATPTPTPVPSPSPLPAPSRVVYEVEFPLAGSDSDRQRTIREKASQGWVCQPNPAGRFLICHRVKP